MSGRANANVPGVPGVPGPGARAQAGAHERFADRYFEYRLGGGLEAFRAAALALEEAVRCGVPRDRLRRTMAASARRALTLALAPALSSEGGAP